MTLYNLVHRGSVLKVEAEGSFDNNYEITQCYGP